MQFYIQLVTSSARLLDDAYRTEKDDDVDDVRERLLLVRRVLVDNEEEETASAAEKEFHRSRQQVGLQMVEKI